MAAVTSARTAAAAAATAAAASPAGVPRVSGLCGRRIQLLRDSASLGSLRQAPRALPGPNRFSSVRLQCGSAAAAATASSAPLLTAAAASAAGMGGEGGSAKEGVLVYGATGLTGRLVAQRVKEVGLTATLAGRSAEKLKPLGEKLQLPIDAFELTDAEHLRAAVAKHKVVLHIAGPFTVTAPPMLEACVAEGTHYLDVTGEFKVMELAKTMDDKAKASNVMVMPATGFDVVPGDCLAVYLKSKLPSATRLDLATFISVPAKDASTQASGGGGVSHGTALSLALYIAGEGGIVRADGKYQPEPIGRRSKAFDVGASVPGMGPVSALSFPAAELSATAFSTSIPNITVYVPGSGGWSLQSLFLSGIGLASRVWPLRSALEAAIRRLPTPTVTLDVERDVETNKRMMCVGEAVDESTGQSAKATVVVPPGYAFTAYACVEIARRVLGGDFKAGFQTPASAYGHQLVSGIPGCAGAIHDVLA